MIAKMMSQGWLTLDAAPKSSAVVLGLTGETIFTLLTIAVLGVIFIAVARVLRGKI